jgi:rubredoxin
MRRSFCKIHAIENEFGLVAYRCPSRGCLRRRFISSGGWLDIKGKPEDTYVYVPLEGVLEDDEDLPPGVTATTLNSLVKCPWCGTMMKPVR